MAIEDKIVNALLEKHRPVTKTYNSVFGSSFNDSQPQQVTQDYCTECHRRYPCYVVRAIEEELKLWQ